MPELVPHSTPTPPITAAVPPAANSDRWESFPVFRETFLMYVTPIGYYAALRAVGEMLYSLLLKTPAEWPGWEESATRTEMRAAAADLRHLQGFLASVGRERELSSLDPEDAYLSNIAAKLSRQIGPRGGRHRARARGGALMGWESKLSYPPDATRRVSVRATPAQKSAWEVAARRHGKASAGAFLAWAGDLYLALHRAWEDAVQFLGYMAASEGRSLNPVGYAEEVKRQEEREKVRREREE